MPNETPFKLKYHTLVRGDGASPNILTCTHRVPIDLPSGTLPSTPPQTAEEIHKRVFVDYVPDWMEGFRSYASLSIERTLGAFKTPSQVGPFEFDTLHRLDEFTFIGQPWNDQVPVLGITLDDEILSDEGGRFADMLEKARTSHGDPDKYFTLTVHPADSLAERYFTAPRLALEENWRFVSYFEDLGVGRPVGSIALTTGENRVIQITHSTTQIDTQTDTDTVVESTTNVSKETFKDTFKRIQRETRKSGSEVNRSRKETRKFGENSGEQSRGGKRTLSVDDFGETTEDTLNEVINTLTEVRSLTLVEKTSSSTTTVDSDVRTITLKNESPQPVTYVYHQIAQNYGTLLELVGISVVLDDLAISRMPTRFQLDGRLTKNLRALHDVGDVKSKKIAAAVLALIKSRYGDLNLVGTGAEPTIKVAKDADATMSLFSLKALRGRRREKDKLPITTRAARRTIQTEDLHVVPHLSEFAIPDYKPVAAPATPSVTV